LTANAESTLLILDWAQKGVYSAYTLKSGDGRTSGTVVKGVEIYQMTENGLALQVALQGAKYWTNDDFN
jgi:hypothetical protein